MNHTDQMKKTLQLIDESGQSRVTLFTDSLFFTEHAGQRLMVSAASAQEARNFVEPHLWGHALSFSPVIPSEALKTTWDSLYVVNGIRDVMTRYALNAAEIAGGKRDGTVVFRLLEGMPSNEPAIITETLLDQFPTCLRTGEKRMPITTPPSPNP